MEISIIEESPKRLVFEIKGEGHTICNILKRALWDNKHIKIATYSVKHPLVGIPRMVVETDGEIKPRKAISDAIEKVVKETEKFRKDFDEETRG